MIVRSVTSVKCKPCHAKHVLRVSFGSEEVVVLMNYAHRQEEFLLAFMNSVEGSTVWLLWHLRMHVNKFCRCLLRQIGDEATFGQASNGDLISS